MADRGYHEAESVAEMLERLSIAEPNSGCHLWLGKVGAHGYAYCAYRLDGKRFHRKAATVAYELAKGRVPPGLEISHTCANVLCVNPDHLLAETHSENIRRRPRYRFVLNCPHCGEPKEFVTSRSKKGEEGEWVCRPCRARRAAEWRAKRSTT